MKRLLAYLFIVLGLGLTFSVSAKAGLEEITFCQSSWNNSFYMTKNYFNRCKKININEFINGFLYKDGNVNIVNKTTLSNHLNSLYAQFDLHNIDRKIINELITSNPKLKNYEYLINGELDKIIIKKKKHNLSTARSYSCGVKDSQGNTACGDKFNKTKKTQIAKAEPSQTQKVVKSSDWRSNMQIESTKTDDSSKTARAYPKTDWNEWKKEQGFAPKDKKVKITKKETKQVEFKPKKTNQDNEAPVIQIASTITVDDASYEIQGKVSDKSNKIFIRIDGRNIAVKNGKFKVKRFSPVDEQIEIIATDQWGNTSKPKLVNIIIDQKDTIVADLFEALDPSVIKTKTNNDRVALIIGIEKYDQTPEASFANLDAKYFYEYARKGFGVSKSNIKLLVDEDAILVKSLGTLNKWLPGKIKNGKTELIIFFAGHGLASSDGKELYLLPHDSDPDLLARTALSRTELFKEIIALNPKSVTMFLDTCYSGVSRDERTLLASARPVRIVADEQDTPNNFTIFSASQLDQISSGLKEAKHGIFSYYLMKGLEGKADTNQDKEITNGELLAYMDENVSQKASELGRQQNPSLAGDPNKVLMSYR